MANLTKLSNWFAALGCAWLNKEEQEKESRSKETLRHDTIFRFVDCASPYNLTNNPSRFTILNKYRVHIQTPHRQVQCIYIHKQIAYHHKPKHGEVCRLTRSNYARHRNEPLMMVGRLTETCWVFCSINFKYAAQTFLTCVVLNVNCESVFN